MAGFIAGALIATILLFGALTIYSLSEMASMYDRKIDGWFDEE